MIPRIDRSRLFPGMVVVYDEEYTWIWDGIYNVFTLFKNGKAVIDER